NSIPQPHRSTRLLRQNGPVFGRHCHSRSPARHRPCVRKPIVHTFYEGHRDISADRGRPPDQRVCAWSLERRELRRSGTILGTFPKQGSPAQREFLCTSRTWSWHASCEYSTGSWNTNAGI